MCLWVIVDGGVDRNTVWACYRLVLWTSAKRADQGLEIGQKENIGKKTDCPAE
jgi:hypothetical protein